MGCTMDGQAMFGIERLTALITHMLFAPVDWLNALVAFADFSSSMSLKSFLRFDLELAGQFAVLR